MKTLVKSRIKEHNKAKKESKEAAKAAKGSQKKAKKKANKGARKEARKDSKKAKTDDKAPKTAQKHASRRGPGRPPKGALEITKPLIKTSITKARKGNVRTYILGKTQVEGKMRIITEITEKKSPNHQELIEEVMFCFVMFCVVMLQFDNMCYSYVLFCFV